MRAEGQKNLSRWEERKREVRREWRGMEEVGAAAAGGGECEND